MLAFHLGFNLSNPLDEERIQTATEQKQLSHAVVSEGLLRTGLGLIPPTGCVQCGVLQRSTVTKCLLSGKPVCFI